MENPIAEVNENRFKTYLGTKVKHIGFAKGKVSSP
jgi:hypothetical protein